MSTITYVNGVQQVASDEIEEYTASMVLTKTSVPTVLMNASAGAIQATLPMASQSEGTRFVIKKTDSSANTVTIIGTNSDTIDGSANKVLSTKSQFIEVQSDGTSWEIIGASSGGTADIPNMCPTITRLVAGSGTYTVPAGVKWLKIKMIGAGGGGSGSSISNEGGAGGAGGTTSFGDSLLTAAGGSGAPYGGVGNGGAGGTATINSPAVTILSLSGARAPGNPNNPSNQQVQSGAASPFAGGASGGYGDSAGYSGIANSGTGGGGGGVTTGYRGTGGGAGGYIEAIIGSPSTTYNYSVGAAGAAGAAGPSGYVGGLGGSGVIIIEEYRF